MSSQPLRNIKVIDFTHLLPGELTGSILADMGADLIRVERLKPGLAQHLPPIVKGESLYYWGVHRDEKRIALDLKQDSAIEIVNKLLQDADVLIENFRPGVMGRLGIGYGKVHKLNPALIYCSISAYGQTGTYSQRPGHDVNLQAEAGVLHVSRDLNGKPQMPGTLLSDYMTALLSAVSILGSVIDREKTAKGRHLDMSMFDSVMWTQSLAATASLYLNQEPQEADPRYRSELANYNVFECKDGRYIAAAPLEPKFWEAFCLLIDRKDLFHVFPFGSNPELRKSIEKVFLEKTMAEWIEIFKEIDCCVSPVNTVLDALEFLPSKERGLVQYVVHPKLGKIPQVRTPLPFGQDTDTDRVANHDIADSTVAVLKNLGYDLTKIAALAQQQVIPGRPKLPI